MENGKITGPESRPKTSHNHFVSQEQGQVYSEPHDTDPQSEVKHTRMMETIIDCDVLMAGGMGRGAYDGLKIRSIQPIITDIRDANEAVETYLKGKIIDHPERLH